ncbi:MAG: periplasmic heavy metal sensor [Candidatus Omnitrophica bacterium]|nr:periplasmic heavy metal sensor [Candidatus Omnitrophota bacterium]
MKILRGVCLGGLMAIFCIGSVWAQPQGDLANDKDGGKKRLVQIAEKLKLSPDQKTKLDANREKARQDLEVVKEQMTAKQKELTQALEATALDRNGVTRIHGEYKTLVAKKEDLRLAAILEVRSILTADQFVQFQNMMADRKAQPKNTMTAAQKLGGKADKGAKAGKGKGKKQAK